MPSSGRPDVSERTPPAPEGLPLLGNAVDFVRDPFGFTADAVAECGDVFRLAVPGRDRYIATHPDQFERALVTERDAFAKTDDFRLAFGRSVISSEGSEWREQRDLLDPFFFRRRIEAYAPQMRRQVTRRTDGWEPGETYSVVAEMKALTFDVLSATLLGRDPGGDGDDRLRRAADDLNAYFAPASWALPSWVPTPDRRRFDRAVETLEAEVRRLLADAAADGDDLLSVLARARGESGYPRSDGAVSDQLVGILFAGHETTALALTFAWALLAEHPEVRARLEAEVDDVVGDGPVTMDHVERLDYVGRVLTETLRLFPPVHTLPRETTQRVELGEYVLPADAEVLLSVVTAHRDERFYDDPESFDPDRWDGDLGSSLPTCAYVPFGAGPRRCLGQAFATVEGKIVLADVARRYRLEHATSWDRSVSPQMTTQPEGEVPMVVRER
jgi:cytochrome P450